MRWPLVLLGLQIFVGGLLTVMGLKLVRYAFRVVGRQNPDAGVLYLLAGLSAVIFGILLISGINLMYFEVLF